MGFKRFVLSQGLDCLCSSAVLCVAHIASTVPSAGEPYDHSCACVCVCGFFYASNFRSRTALAVT